MRLSYEDVRAKVGEPDTTVSGHIIGGTSGMTHVR